MAASADIERLRQKLSAVEESQAARFKAVLQEGEREKLAKELKLQVSCVAQRCPGTEVPTMNIMLAKNSQRLPAKDSKLVFLNLVSRHLACYDCLLA